MPDGKPPLHETDEEDRKRRQQVLRSLAQPPDTVPAPATATTLTSPPRRHVSRVVVIAMFGVALLVGLGYYAFFRQIPTNTTTAPLVVSSTANHLACMKGMALSPDGKTVAILGYQRDCPSANLQSYAYHPGQINLLSIATGHFIASIQPDDIITNILHPQVPPEAQPASRGDDTSHLVIRYNRIVWSPDGAQLAIFFALDVYPSAASQAGVQQSTTFGVLLSDVHGAHTRVLSHTLDPFTVPTGAWNLKTGAYIPIPAGVDQSNWSPVPPALSYTWDSTDSLVAHGSTLSRMTVPSTPEVGPIGNPIGDHSFTIWQPAQIQPIVDTTASSLPSSVPGAYYFRADFSAWSPDGARLFLNMTMNNDFVLIAQGNGSGNDLGRAGSQMVLLPVRDKGLATAVTDLKLTVNPDGSPQELDAAWRPDGRVIAVSIPPISLSTRINSGPAQVRLYDCMNGRLLGSLQGQPLSNTQQAGALYLRWTPDGSHLLLLDAGNGKLTIWGPDQLPKSNR